MTNYLISYDISDTKLRSRLSKTLLQSGCIRVQKSVFFAPDFKTEELKTLRKTLTDLLRNKVGDADSLLCITIDKQSLRRMIWAEGEGALLRDAQKRHSKIM